MHSEVKFAVVVVIVCPCGRLGVYAHKKPDPSRKMRHLFGLQLRQGRRGRSDENVVVGLDRLGNKRAGEGSEVSFGPQIPNHSLGARGQPEHGPGDGDVNNGVVAVVDQQRGNPLPVGELLDPNLTFACCRSVADKHSLKTQIGHNIGLQSTNQQPPIATTHSNHP